jgi:hypothetical protein
MAWIRLARALQLELRRPHAVIGGDLDEILERAALAQNEFVDFGNTVTGFGRLLNPGVKKRWRIEDKAATKDYVDPAHLTDIARVGFAVDSPAEADQIVQRLAGHFTAHQDRGWKWNAVDGYLHRRIIVLTKTGTRAEIELVPTSIEEARNGPQQLSRLYEAAQEVPPGSPGRNALEARMRRGYGAALRGTQFESLATP